MAVQIGQSEDRTGHIAQEGKAAKVGAKLPDTHADVYLKKKEKRKSGCCDRRVNGAADPAPSWKNISDIRVVVVELLTVLFQKRKPGQKSLEDRLRSSHLCAAINNERK